MLQKLSNYIMTLGEDVYQEIEKELSRLGDEFTDYMGNDKRFPMINELLDINNPKFFINGQFRMAPDLIPYGMIIEGIPFELQRRLIIGSTLSPEIFTQEYDELRQLNPNISEQQARQVYSQLKQYYDHYFENWNFYGLFEF